MAKHEILVKLQMNNGVISFQKNGSICPCIVNRKKMNKLSCHNDLPSLEIEGTSQENFGKTIQKKINEG